MTQGAKQSSGLAATLRRNAYSYLLMGGHIGVDMCQGALAATLPFLIAANGYSYAQVTMLIFAANIASAIIQPLFGWLGDRKPRPWIMALGVLLAGAGMAGVGVLPRYWMIALSSMICGVGIAMLHPEGGRLANLVASKSKEGGMSIFSVGGQVGFCVGPMIAAAALGLFGLKGTLVFLVLCAPYAALLLAFNKRLAAFGLKDASAVEASGGKDRWGAFALVLSTLSIRSVVFYSMSSFAPLFVISFFGQTEEQASLMVSLLALSGAIATMLSSKAAHAVGTQRLMICCYVVLVVGLVAFAFSPSLLLCCVLVVVLAFGMNTFNPPAIALGQSYVPHHLGMASGLSFGVAVCIGGVVAPGLGTVGDILGLRPVILIAACIAALGLLLSVAVSRLK